MTSTPGEQVTLISKLIRSGRLDKYLEDIEGLIRARRVSRGNELYNQLDEGDMIQLIEAVKPKLLANKRAIVRGFTPNGQVRVTLVATLSPKWRQDIPIAIKPPADCSDCEES